jgi:hypothetical protein
LVDEDETREREREREREEDIRELGEAMMTRPAGKRIKSRSGWPRGPVTGIFSYHPPSLLVA